MEGLPLATSRIQGLGLSIWNINSKWATIFEQWVWPTKWHVQTQNILKGTYSLRYCPPNVAMEYLHYETASVCRAKQQV